MEVGKKVQFSNFVFEKTENPYPVLNISAVSGEWSMSIGFCWPYAHFMEALIDSKSEESILGVVSLPFVLSTVVDVDNLQGPMMKILGEFGDRITEVPTDSEYSDDEILRAEKIRHELSQE